MQIYSAILTLLILVTTILADYPSSSKIVSVSSDIIESAFSTCTDEEKNSLKEAEAAVDEGLASIEADLADAIDAFEGLGQLFLILSILKVFLTYLQMPLEKLHLLLLHQPLLQHQLLHQ